MAYQEMLTGSSTVTIMSREAILNHAHRCVCGAREQDYGSPEDSFGMIASFWDAYLSASERKKPLTARDVAAMLALLKIARIAVGGPHIDNWVDLAGYAACGGEIEERAKHGDVHNTGEVLQ